MIKKRLVSALTAAAVAALMPAFSAFAEAPESIAPLFKAFNKNDVNGRVIVSVPEGIAANIGITFDSPEWKDEVYYSLEAAGPGEYSFDIEGRDTTADDYRNYKLTVSLADKEVAAFDDTFNIADVNDNPDSFKTLTYNFVIDDVVSESDWDSVTDNGVTTVSYHLNSFTLGDVNEDGKVDAKDASAVLVYYSSMSTGRTSSLSESGKKAANVNGDSLIDAKDASRILVYYTAASTGADPKWD